MCVCGRGMWRECSWLWWVKGEVLQAEMPDPTVFTKVQEVFLSKRFSVCCMPLVHFQSSKMIVLIVLSNFIITFWGENFPYSLPSYSRSLMGLLVLKLGCASHYYRVVRVLFMFCTQIFYPIYDL